MSKNEKPDHPAPWEWKLPDAQLYDAAGVKVIGACGLDGATGVAFLRSSHARELIRAAPEMEALLRQFVDMPEKCEACGVFGGHRDDCKLMGVLAALDAARKGVKVPRGGAPKPAPPFLVRLQTRDGSIADFNDLEEAADWATTREIVGWAEWTTRDPGRSAWMAALVSSEPSVRDDRAPVAPWTTLEAAADDEDCTYSSCGLPPRFANPQTGAKACGWHAAGAGVFGFLPTLKLLPTDRVAIPTKTDT